MARGTILVVDDEPKIVDIVRAYLAREDYRVLVAYDGREALVLARREQPDLLVLDLMLPEVSGWDVCRTLRAESAVPIIMLTARDDTTDKIVGLELGADDYLAKPFDPKELVARVHAVLRRAAAAGGGSGVLRHGDLEIDRERHVVRRAGQPVNLTPSEFALLQALAERPGRVWTRLQLLDRLQGVAFEGYERAVDSHVKNLRQKIEPNPRQPRYVQTVYGVGYKLADAEEPVGAAPGAGDA
ncbi:MAG TPA: response regulator transcription factor [Chloroflexota bacterium]|nr:response regulator transcription factor [Chloroflexota bacterium]